MSLAKECYSMKLELLINATIIDGAMRQTKSALFYLSLILLNYSSVVTL